MSRTQGEPTTSLRTVVLWITVFSRVLCGAQAALKTTYFDGLCADSYFQSAWIDLNHLQSGILVSYVSSTDAYEEEDCTVRLKPDRGASVVLSVYQYNLAPEDELTIEDSQKFKVALLGSGDFPDERKSFFSDGVMTLHYKRRSTNGTAMSGGRRLRFHFVFTQVREGPCRPDEFTCRNRRCIPMKLVCDRHNHCGDNSDQEDCAPRRLIPTATTYPRQTTTVRYSKVWLGAIIVSAAIVLIIIVVFSAVLIKAAVDKKKRKKKAAAAVSRVNAPLPSVAAAAPPNAQSPTAPPAAPTTATPAPLSVFGRLRQSFRGHPKNSTTRSPEVSAEAGSEKYEVPSMYPQLPSAPHLAGVDNPDFKADE